jgi:hypothetical protein
MRWQIFTFSISIELKSEHSIHHCCKSVSFQSKALKMLLSSVLITKSKFQRTRNMLAHASTLMFCSINIHSSNNNNYYTATFCYLYPSLNTDVVVFYNILWFYINHEHPTSRIYILIINSTFDCSDDLTQYYIVSRKLFGEHMKRVWKSNTTLFCCV